MSEGYSRFMILIMLKYDIKKRIVDSKYGFIENSCIHQLSFLPLNQKKIITWI